MEMARRQAIRVYFGWPWFGIRVALPLFQICTFGLSLNQDCESSLSEKPVELLAAPFVWMVCVCVYESIVFFVLQKYLPLATLWIGVGLKTLERAAKDLFHYVLNSSY